MLPVIFSIIGIVIGGLTADNEGAVFGFFVGLLAGLSLA